MSGYFKISRLIFLNSMELIISLLAVSITYGLILLYYLIKIEVLYYKASFGEFGYYTLLSIVFFMILLILNIKILANITKAKCISKKQTLLYLINILCVGTAVNLIFSITKIDKAYLGLLFLIIKITFGFNGIDIENLYIYNIFILLINIVVVIGYINYIFCLSVLNSSNSFPDEAGAEQDSIDNRSVTKGRRGKA